MKKEAPERGRAGFVKPSQRVAERQVQPRAAAGRRLGDFLPLLPGEQALLHACRRGELAVLGAQRPEAADDTNRVRADFLRFFLLGGDAQAPVHERGVQLVGAWVEGALDLDGCEVRCRVGLLRSHFEGLIRAQDARLAGVLVLNGCHLEQGLNADRVRAEGSVFLSEGFHAQGEVRLLGAQIGGNLVCIGGRFEVEEGDALSADGVAVKGDVCFCEGFQAKGEVRLPGAQIGGDLACNGGHFEVKEGDALSADGVAVKGNVFLSDGFQAKGKVRLLGAQIGGNLECAGGRFEVEEGDALSADGVAVKGNLFLNVGFQAKGKVRLPGAQIGGNLACTGGHLEVKVGDALSLERAEIQGAWFLRGTKAPTRINAGHLSVGVLVDEVGRWAPGSVLDGFRYAALGGVAPTDGAARLDWLRQQSPAHLGEREGGEDFRPQPWRQLQKVLREMGHAEDARQIGMSFERHLRRAGRVGQSPAGTARWRALPKQVLAMFLHRLFGLLAGYGYRPMRLLAWMLTVWLSFGVFFWALALPPRSALAPSNPLVFQNAAYEECLPDREPQPGNWFLCPPLRGEYATLSPLVFSLDIILPLVDLGQEKHWGAYVATPKSAPNAELWAHWSWGHLARLLIWFETLFGWVCSLLLVAIVSGFARRSDEG